MSELSTLLDKPESESDDDDDEKDTGLKSRGLSSTLMRREVARPVRIMDRLREAPKPREERTAEVPGKDRDSARLSPEEILVITPEIRHLQKQFHEEFAATTKGQQTAEQAVSEWDELIDHQMDADLAMAQVLEDYGVESEVIQSLQAETNHLDSAELVDDSVELENQADDRDEPTKASVRSSKPSASSKSSVNMPPGRMPPSGPTQGQGF
jgi:hypothetical protein